MELINKYNVVSWEVEQAIVFTKKKKKPEDENNNNKIV